MDRNVDGETSKEFQSLQMYQQLIVEIKEILRPQFLDAPPTVASETEAMEFMAKRYSSHLTAMYQVNDACDLVTAKLVTIWTGQPFVAPTPIAPTMQGASSTPTPSAAPDDAAIRKEARELVEENWRLFLRLAARGRATEAKRLIESFQGKMVDYSMRFNSATSARFLELIEEYRNVLSDEYAQSPDRLKRRLSLINEPTTAQAGRVGRYGDLEKLAVRTAVRATIWQSIRSIFR